MKVFIMGPSGAGTTTLAIELSKQLKISHEDSDNMFWEDTDPPFSTQRKIEDLHKLFYQFTSQENFILSGDVLNWRLPNEELLQSFTHLIYLYTPWEIREKRIRSRESARFGDRIKPNGDMYKTHEAFLTWASKYETAQQVGRNKVSQKSFIEQFTKASGFVLEIEKNLSLKKTIDESLLFLNLNQATE